MAWQHFVTPGAPEASPEYDLVAVLVHLDLFNISAFGHYICYNRIGNSWFKFDDTKLTEVPEKEVLKLNAYLVRLRFKLLSSGSMFSSLVTHSFCSCCIADGIL